MFAYPLTSIPTHFQPILIENQSHSTAVDPKSICFFVILSCMSVTNGSTWGREAKQGLTTPQDPQDQVRECYSKSHHPLKYGQPRRLTRVGPPAARFMKSPGGWDVGTEFGDAATHFQPILLQDQSHSTGIDPRSICWRYAELYVSSGSR